MFSTRPNWHFVGAFFCPWIWSWAVSNAAKQIEYQAFRQTRVPSFVPQELTAISWGPSAWFSVTGQLRYLDEYLDDLASIKKNLGLLQAELGLLWNRKIQHLKWALCKNDFDVFFVSSDLCLRVQSKSPSSRQEWNILHFDSGCWSLCSTGTYCRLFVQVRCFSWWSFTKKRPTTRC